MICGKVKKPCFLYVFHKRVPVSFLPRFYPVGMDTSQRIHIALVVVDHGPCEGRVWGKHLSCSVLPWCNVPPLQLPILPSSPSVLQAAHPSVRMWVPGRTWSWMIFIRTSLVLFPPGHSTRKIRLSSLGREEYKGEVGNAMINTQDKTG